MLDTSVFDLLYPAQTPQEADLRAWIIRNFPQSTKQTAFQLAVQLEKLFEMAVFENQVDDVHNLLQQGVPPDLRFDWGLTPLMWANCLKYDELAELLEAYGANPQLKSFSGTTAKAFQNVSSKQNSVEVQAILKRRDEIHALVKAGCLKPLSGASGKKVLHKTRKNRQIDNGIGVDETLKRMSQNP